MAKGGYVVWHVRNPEGFVEAVFASPKSQWVSLGDKYAKEQGWEWAAGDQEASFYDNPDDGEPVGSIEKGVPGQPFSFVHVVGGPFDNRAIDVEKTFGGWARTPEALTSRQIKGAKGY